LLEIDRIYCIDCLEGLRQVDAESVDCVVTSPPYWGLRDYGIDGQFGLEKTPEEYVQKMVLVFREVKRVLKKTGTVWLNLGDSYAGGSRDSNPNGKQGTNRGTVEFQPGHFKGFVPFGLKSKDLVGIPWRVAFALQQDGWWLRQDIIWSKPNPMPESVTDRCTKSHEYVFLLSKSRDYFYDAESIREPSDTSGGACFGKQNFDSTGTLAQSRKLKSDKEGSSVKYWSGANKRSVWTVTTKPFSGAHFATFPPDLIEPMIKAGCPKDGLVLDPFIGAGTTGLVARKLLRHYIGFELNPEYIRIAEKRLSAIPERLEVFS
jgi:DNA modification methylase